MKSLVENIIREEVRNVVKEYFGSLLELQKGPVFQVHAAATRNGLTKAVRERPSVVNLQICGETMRYSSRLLVELRFSDGTPDGMEHVSRCRGSLGLSGRCVTTKNREVFGSPELANSC